MSHLMKHGNRLRTRALLVAGNADLLDVAADLLRRHEDLALVGATEGGEGVVRKAAFALHSLMTTT